MSGEKCHAFDKRDSEPLASPRTNFALPLPSPTSAVEVGLDGDLVVWATVGSSLGGLVPKGKDDVGGSNLAKYAPPTIIHH
jgi:hypothetical protein